MNKRLKEFFKYAKKDEVFIGIITLIVTWFLVEDIRVELTGWIKSEFGVPGEITTTVSLVLIAIAFKYILFIKDERKKAELKANPTSELLQEKYKGLIVSVSLITESKKDILDKIDAIKSLNDKDGLELIYTTRGIGQTFRAIIHHLGELTNCWLLCTGDAEMSKELVEYFIKKFSKSIRVHPRKINDPFKVEETFNVINKIYSEEIKKCALNENQVIADLTGGTAIMSCAMVLSCLSPDRDMEYVLQKDKENERKLKKINENVSELVFRR